MPDSEGAEVLRNKRAVESLDDGYSIKRTRKKRRLEEGAGGKRGKEEEMEEKKRKDKKRRGRKEQEERKKMRRKKKQKQREVVKARKGSDGKIDNQGDQKEENQEHDLLMQPTEMVDNLVEGVQRSRKVMKAQKKVMKAVMKRMKMMRKAMVKRMKRMRKDVVKKMKAQGIQIRELVEKHQHSQTLHDTTIRIATLPIVAAILYKKIYNTGMGSSGTFRQSVSTIPGHIKAFHREFRLFGMENGEICMFADTWDDIIEPGNFRNLAVHSICGDDVITVLPYAPRGIRMVLERGFKLVFGVAVGDWGRATPGQKRMKIQG